LFDAPIQTERNVVQAAESNLPVGALQVPEMAGNIVAGGAGKAAGLISQDTGTTIAARLQQAKGYENKVNQLIAQHPEATDAILAAVPGYDSLVKGRKVLESLNTVLGGKPYDPNAPESQIGAMAGQVAGGSKVPLPKLGSTGEVAADVAGIGQKALTDAQRENIFTSLQQPSTGIVGKIAQTLTPPLISKAAKLAGITEKSPTPLSKFSSLNNLNDEVDRLTESVGGIQQQISDLGAGDATAANPKYRGLTKELNQTKADLETAQKAQDLVNQKIANIQNRGGLISNTVTSGLRGAGTGALVGGVSGALTNAPGEPVSRDIVRGGAFGGTLGAAGAATEQLTRPSETPAPETPTQQPPVLPATPQEATVGTPEAKAGTPAPETATPAPVATPAPTQPVKQRAGTGSIVGPGRVRARLSNPVEDGTLGTSHENEKMASDVLLTGNSPVKNSVEVNSGKIDRIGYDPNSKLMYVKLKQPTADGFSQYLYHNVTPQEHAEFLSSKSAGKYFDDNVKYKFETSAVDPYHTYQDLLNDASRRGPNPPPAAPTTPTPQPTAPAPQASQAPEAPVAQPASEAPAPFMGSVPAMPATKVSQKVSLASPVTVAQNAPVEMPKPSSLRALADQLERTGTSRVEAQSLAAQANAERLAKGQLNPNELTPAQLAQKQAIEDQLAQEEYLRKSPTGANALKKSLTAKQAIPPEIPVIETPAQKQARLASGLSKAEYQKMLQQKSETSSFDEARAQALEDQAAEEERLRQSPIGKAKLNKALTKQQAISKKVSLAASQPHEGPEENPLGTSSP